MLLQEDFTRRDTPLTSPPTWYNSSWATKWEFNNEKHLIYINNNVANMLPRTAHAS